VATAEFVSYFKFWADKVMVQILPYVVHWFVSSHFSFKCFILLIYWLSSYLPSANISGRRRREPLAVNPDTQFSIVANESLAIV